MDLPTPSGVPTIFGPGQAPQAVKHGAKAVSPDRSRPAQREPEAPKAPAESPEASTSKGAHEAPKAPAESPEASTSKGAHEAEGRGNAWTASAEELLSEGMPEIGSVVRVSGLKSLPELNGTLAEVVRPAASQRVVVQTCAGEKALRRSNLDESLHALLPPWAAPVGAALVLCTLVAAVAGRPLGAALLPLLALGWAGGTLALCLGIYRCCWHAWYLPSFSAVCGRKPNRTLLRLGFLVAGILLFTSNWLYGELVVPQILDGPIQLETEEMPPVVAHEAEDAGNATDNASLDNATLNSTENATENATVVKRPRIPSPAMIQGSLLYGYIAAFTFSLVGLCFCDGRWWTTLIHVMLGIIFTFAGWQHTWTSSSLLTSARGRRYAEYMGELYSIAKFRQMISDFAPLVALGVPITAQVLCQSRITQRRGSLSTMSFLETSGILLSMKALQWGLMLTYLIFVGSYAVDFWILSQLPPDEELI